MNWLWRLLKKLRTFIRSKRVIRAQHVTALPAKLDKLTLYVVGQNGHRWHVAMLCPCGCNATLFMNLLADEVPCWTLTEHQGRIASLHPSVWRKVGCRSHFFLLHGEIQWCSES